METNWSDVASLLKKYNSFHEGSNLELLAKNQADETIFIEGRLRIYWGATLPIHFQETDPVESLNRNNRRSFNPALRRTRDGEDTLKLHDTPDIETIPLGDDETLPRASPLHRTQEVEDLSVKSLDLNNQPEEISPSKKRFARSSTFGTADTLLRKKVPRRQRCQRRMSMINGHLYKPETSVFTPLPDSVISVHVTSEDTAPEVVKMLLSKFKIRNPPEDFCLCTVKTNGEVRKLTERDKPLLERIGMGPVDTEAKLYIKEKSNVQDITHEVADLMSAPDNMLQTFLQNLQQETIQEEKEIRDKYERYELALLQQLQFFEEASDAQELVDQAGVMSYYDYVQVVYPYY